MSLAVAIQMDPIETINVAADSTFMLALEAQARGHRLYHYLPRHLSLIDGRVIAKAREVIGDGPTYVSFDVDGLDPAFAPGTGTPEAGGLTPREAQQILHGLRGADIIGGDVVEVAPQYDATSNTAMVGAQMLFEIFSLMVLGRNFKRRS